MTVLIDSASTTGYGDTNCDSSQLDGQCFTVANDCNLYSLTVDMRTNGTPSGSFQFEIYALTGSYGSTAVPTGAVLATSDTVNVSSLTGTYASYTTYFTGANAIAMTTGQQYFWTCNYANTAFPNAIYFHNKTPSFHGGNQAYKASGVWNALGAYDMMFDLQGTTGSGAVVPIANLLTLGVG